MNAKRLLSLWGLKWNPFSPELPSEGLLVTAAVENFAWRVEQLVQEGGFAAGLSGSDGDRRRHGPSGGGDAKSTTRHDAASRSRCSRCWPTASCSRGPSSATGWPSRMSVWARPWSRWSGPAASAAPRAAGNASTEAIRPDRSRSRL